MKILLLLTTLCVSLQSYAEVVNLKACTDRSQLVSLLQQDNNGQDRLVLQKFNEAPQTFNNCTKSENDSFEILNCKGSEAAESAQIKVNKETLGATLTLKSFFAKSFALSCREFTL